MKEFFKFAFASFLGTIVAGAVIVGVVVLIIFGIVAAESDKSVDVDTDSVLQISLNSEITERTPNDPLAGIFGSDADRKIGLNDILADIRKAKTDNNIKGIFLEESDMMPGQATSEEIRNALIDFKTSGKFIIAYAEIYTQSFYYIASVADKVYITPSGGFEFSGFSQQVTFLKGALDKLGIEVQVLKVGTYKSAVEPFFLTKMSPANREQVTSYLGSLYDHFLTGISQSRHISKDSLFDIANNLKVRFPQDALHYHLVDGLKYKDEVLDELKHLTGVGYKSNLRAVSIMDYTKAEPDKKDDDKKESHNRIALIYASGEIAGGEGDDNSIGSERISKAIRQARLDDRVKAVVLRVNSPGGSSIASDVIWREVVLTKKVKPIIVSMGDYAASGGYYISCAADSIFAEPNTITGSIGIFAILPNMQKFFNDKLGVTFDGVQTGKYADMGDVSRPLTPEERAILQNQVDHGYDEFTKAVAAGRHKTQDYINSIGQGRVWTGEQAVKNGLVDRLGNINDAIKSAARAAKIKNYKIEAYPEQKSIFDRFGLNVSDELKMRAVKSELGEDYVYYQELKDLKKMMKVPQARLPYTISIN
jgi:protease-4